MFDLLSAGSERARLRLRLTAIAVAAVLCVVAGACSERLRGGLACPDLCPNENVTVLDTTFSGASVITTDTSIIGFPNFGQWPYILLATGSPDPSTPIDIRGIIRFDSISYLFVPPDSTSAVAATMVDSAYLRLHFDTLSLVPGPSGSITISAYDVDTSGFDTSTTVLASLFRSDRFLGSATLPAQTSPKRDTVLIPLDTGKVGAHVRTGQVLRIGLQITSPGPARVNILPVVSGSGPQFSYRPDSDTAVAAFTDAPSSLTPSGADSTLRLQLLNYPLAVAAPPLPPPTALAVGGYPSARGVVIFNLPSRIVDSSTIVRATLTLHQPALPYYTPSDTFTIFPQAVLTTGYVTDPGKIALFLAVSTLVGIDSAIAIPASTDSVNVEFVNEMRRWYQRGTDTVTRAIVLRVANEGATLLGANFYSTRSPVDTSLQPHVHIAYVKPVPFGLP